MDSSAWDRAYDAGELSLPVTPHPELAALAGLPPGRALELGCGEGRQAIWLAGKGWRVTAIDFSPVAVARARRLAAHHGVEVDFLVADVREFRPPTVDLVVILYLHTDLTEVLPAAVSALAPGGTLFVLGWDQSSAGGPAGKYTVAGLAEAAADLRVQRAERIPQAGSPNAVDALLVAKAPGNA